MKKILPFLLLLILLFGCGKKEEHKISDTGFFYEITENGCCITGYSGTEAHIDFPEIIDGYVVTSLSPRSFAGFVALESVFIPETVTDISYAFTGCETLTSVSGGSGLVHIDGAFEGCTALVSVTLYDKVETMDNAFRGCTSLKSASIPPSVGSCVSAFEGCTSLTEVTVNRGVSRLDMTFADCISLPYISIPNTVSELLGTFRGCSALEAVDGVDYSVKVIDGAFADCTNLKSVTLGSSIDVLENAFTGCRSLIEVRCFPDSLTRYSPSFAGCSSIEFIKIPYISDESSLSHYRLSDDLRGCTSLTNLVIVPSVTVSESFCKTFADCENLVNITMSNETLEQLAYPGFLFTDSVVSDRLLPDVENQYEYLKSFSSHRLNADYAEIDGISYSRIQNADVYKIVPEDLIRYSTASDFKSFGRTVYWFGFAPESKELTVIKRDYSFTLMVSGINSGRLPSTVNINGQSCAVLNSLN